MWSELLPVDVLAIPLDAFKLTLSPGASDDYVQKTDVAEHKLTRTH